MTLKQDVKQKAIDIGFLSIVQVGKWTKEDIESYIESIHIIKNKSKETRLTSTLHLFLFFTS